MAGEKTRDEGMVGQPRRWMGVGAFAAFRSLVLAEWLGGVGEG